MNDSAAVLFFDVSVVHREGPHYWLTVDCDQGSLKALSVSLPGWGIDLGAGRTPLEWLDRVIRTAAFARDDGRILGAALTDLVFGNNEVRRLFAQLRGVARNSGRQIVVQILGAPDAVAEWPWELMNDPEAPDCPLVLSPGLHLSRTPKMRSYPIRPTAIEPPLNVLVVMSNPLGRGSAREVAPFDLYEEKRHLLRDLTPLMEAGLIQVDVDDRPTVRSLRQAVRRRRRGYHVLHYLGHASPNGLWIENRSGAGEVLPSARLAEILGQNPDLKLALFAGCETARAPDSDGTRSDPGLSIAHQVVRDAAPIVLGMQVVLPFHTQRLFTRAFYEALTAGHPVARALHLARGSVRDGYDGHSRQLDWAIPTLFLGGAEPGPVMDPRASVLPVARPPCISLRIAPMQRDLRFVARHQNLRRVIDVLSGREHQRLICISGTGARREDLSSLLDRAIEELEPEIARLSFSVRDLGDDPAQRLRTCFLDILQQTGWDSTRFETAGADIRDDILLGQLSQIPLAIAIDHADELPADSRALELLRELIRRLGRVRLAIVHADKFNPFNEGLLDYSEHSDVTQLTWTEVWNWIRGQLPELSQRGEDRVRALHGKFGDRLEEWEALHRKLIREPEAQRDLFLDRLSGRRSEPAPGEGEGQLVFSSRDRLLQEITRESLSAQVGMAGLTGLRLPDQPADPPPGPKPVSIAVAGPFTDGRDDAFIDAIARFADDHGVPGSVAGSAGKGTSIVAQTRIVQSPFAGGGSATSADLIRWVTEISRIETDILVCDFGSPQEIRALSEVLHHLINRGTLVFAAAGHAGRPEWPAWQPGVIAVGASSGGVPVAYSPHFPGDGKPDLYAPETLRGTSLASWVEDPDAIGTTYSALYAAAVAALVWANFRALSDRDVLGILLDPGPRDGPPVLDAQEALERMAGFKIRDLLETGDMALPRLVSESGLPPDLVMRSVGLLVEAGTLSWTGDEAGGLLSFPLRISRRYEMVRETEPGAERTLAQEKLVADARAVAWRRNLTAAETRVLWDSGQPGQRIFALANMYERPDARSLTIVLDGIRHSASAFEQYHAMRIAEVMSPDLGPDDRAALRRALEEPKTVEKFDTERVFLAQRILREL